MARSHRIVVNSWQSNCRLRSVGLGKGVLLGLGLMLASGQQVAAATLTAQCQLTASGAGSRLSVIGSFTVRGRFKDEMGGSRSFERSMMVRAITEGLYKCTRDALNGKGNIPSCWERQNYQHGRWSEIRGWKWDARVKDQAMKLACGGHPGEQVSLVVTCTEGPSPRFIWSGRCPSRGRPAPPPLPKLPPTAAPQQELSLACLQGAVVDGKCVCLPGYKPKLIGPKAYQCVKNINVR